MATFQSMFRKSYGFFCDPFPEKALPTAPWKPSDAVKMVLFSSLLLIIVSYGGFFLAMQIWGQIPAAEFLLNNKQEIIIAGILLQVLSQVGFLFWYSRKKYGAGLSDLGFRKIPFKTTFGVFVLLFCTSIALQNGYFFGLNLLGIGSVANSGTVEQLISERWISPPLLFVFAGIIAPVLEELIFRGFLLSGFLKKMNAFHAIALSSLFFAAAHLHLGLFPVYFVLGVLLGTAFIRTKSLYPGIAFHAVNNTIAFIAVVSGS
ncbi:CPBP family intramembrane metalloprotease [Candidatus Peregrinibacteria bacterium]|nr:MAG: CPBP family intramembrane metalloprotease [Candidatus Peregrinibacteria bacterium]